ncbi:hypothetical protein [Pallidibacillus pasinlerensis]|uniref:Uncharacterized protein n=1 Tax=Pallidibacillus pasinlerensis TaxID=2703818 RepID=A0ABX0A5Y7_9BACI|nr:hypothetical protein [Pallidibacillus pasinlerensis]NCU18806.1 hypothetical protein [Pallidibacillus pasinlerensis]
MYDALTAHPNLITIEDFISQYGEKWGFDEETVEKAKRNSELYDEIANKKDLVCRGFGDFYIKLNTSST